MTATSAGKAAVGNRPRPLRGDHVLVAGCALVVLAALVSLSVGPTGVTLAALPDAVSALFGLETSGAANAQLVLLEIRLPRTLLAIFVGASLAVAGAMLQGLFRNPLADPGLIGVSSGAALAAVATIAFGNAAARPMVDALGSYALPLAAFVGGFATTGLLVLIARRRRDIMMGTLLLAGIAIAALAQSLSGFIAWASDDRELRDLTLWTLGSLSGASWAKVVGVLPFALLTLLLVPRVSRSLNGFLLGEAEAFHLGVDVERTKLTVVLATAAAVGAAVAVAGVIGFVGIVVPHLARLLTGPDHRLVLPASALFGGTLVLAADIVARMAARPAELPLGVVMAAIGAPVFLHLVLRRGAGVAA